MGQHICFGAICDFVANSHINIIEGTIAQNTDYMDICHIEHTICPFITFLTFKSGLATNNHIGLLSVCLIINIFPFFFQTGICYVFYALDRHHNLLVLTYDKLMTIKPLFVTNFNWNWQKLEYRGLVEIQKAN